jgi:uncharacterized membrane protein YdfJ with MMPL/SSD domain
LVSALLPQAIIQLGSAVSIGALLDTLIVRTLIAGSIKVRLSYWN